MASTPPDPPITIILADDLPSLENGASLASKKAESLTDLEYKTELNTQCSLCRGSGLMGLKVRCRGKPTTETNVPCFTCDGNGNLNPDQLYASLYHRNLWCRCPDDPNQKTLVAKDGRSVFNNDTYVCGSCGQVTQFG